MAKTATNSKAPVDPAPTEGSAVLCSDFACTLALKWFVLDGQNALLTSLCTNFPMTVQSNPAMPNLEARWKDPKKLDATIDQVHFDGIAQMALNLCYMPALAGKLGAPPV